MRGSKKIAGIPRRIAVGIAVGLLLLAAGLSLTDRGHPTLGNTASSAEPVDLAAAESSLQVAPKTFSGTTPDGHLELSADGQALRINPGLRRFFDYYLLAEGEASDEQIDQLVRSRIAAQSLGPAAQAQAREIWQRYRRFRRAVVLLARAESGAGDALQGVERLQKQIFGARLAQALFSDTERQRLHAAHLLKLVTDPMLPRDVKQQALQNVQQEGPYATRLYAGNSLQATELTAAANRLLTHGERGPWESLLQRYRLSDAMAQSVLAAVRNAGSP
jgi:lipase chaperone LimK